RYLVFAFFFQAEDGIRDGHVTGVQTCALPICRFGFGSHDLVRVRSNELPADGALLHVGIVGGRRRTVVPIGRCRRRDRRRAVVEIGRASCRERVQRGEGGHVLEGERRCLGGAR